MTTPDDSSASKKLRLFIALELPEPMRDELAATQERLRRKLKFALKWVKPDGIHLTLKFLGAVVETRVNEIQEALAATAAGHSPVSLSLGKLGSFGGRRPRVAWVGVDGDTQQLVALQASIDRAMAGLRFEPEVRAYSAHLTVARVPDGLNRLQLDEVTHAIAHTPPPAPTTATFGEVSLMQSTLRRDGAVYTRLFAAPMRQP